jgi:hypothetical protein
MKNQNQNPVQVQKEQNTINRSDLFTLAWQFVKRNGYTISQALKTAWQNLKLKLAMRFKIVKFYYTKVDGSIREAYCTLCERLTPELSSTDKPQRMN